MGNKPGGPAEPGIARGVPKLRQTTSLDSHNTGDRALAGVPDSGMQDVSPHAEPSCACADRCRAGPKLRKRKTRHPPSRDDGLTPTALARDRLSDPCGENWGFVSVPLRAMPVASASIRRGHAVKNRPGHWRPGQGNLPLARAGWARLPAPDMARPNAKLQQQTDDIHDTYVWYQTQLALSERAAGKTMKSGNECPTYRCAQVGTSVLDEIFPV
jgi:hypothetical protein